MMVSSTYLDPSVISPSGLGIVVFSDRRDPTRTAGIVARFCGGYVYDQEGGLLVEARSNLRPDERHPWAHSWLKEEAIRTVEEAAWISGDDRSLLVGHIRSTPYLRIEADIEWPHINMVTSGGLTCCAFPAEDSPIGVVFHLVRQTFGIIDDETGLLAEMTSGRGPIPWFDRDAKLDAIFRAEAGVYTDTEEESERLAAHIKATPYLSDAAA